MLIALGTDFPVERVSPSLTFYAAVARKHLDGYPEDGFQMNDALSREETLKGMTLWAAYSNFEEHEKGSIEVGKMADFVILSEDIMTVEADEIPISGRTGLSGWGKEKIKEVKLKKPKHPSAFFI